VFRKEKVEEQFFTGFRPEFHKRQVNDNSFELLSAENVVKKPGSEQDEVGLMEFGLYDALRVP